MPPNSLATEFRFLKKANCKTKFIFGDAQIRMKFYRPAIMSVSPHRARHRLGFARLPTLAFGAFFLSSAFVLFSFRFQPSRGEKDLVISFQTEGGFTNQLLDVVYLTTVAIALKPCSIVLPTFSKDGTQVDGKDAYASQRVQFEELFDLMSFTAFLAQQGVQIRDNEHQEVSLETPCGIICRRETPLAHCLSRIKNGFPISCMVSSVHFEAPFLHGVWSTEFLYRYGNDFLRVLDQMRPSYRVEAKVNKVHSLFMQQSSKKCMHFIHARIEEDWHRHCLRWHPHSSQYAYNCYVGFEEILNRVVELDIVEECDFHLTYDKGRVKSTVDRNAIAQSAGVNLIEQPDSQDDEGREVKAAVQFFLAVRAEKFIGNSVSTLSALIILKRQLMNLWWTQYNRGPIPLASFVPGYRLPWVFTVSGTDEKYDSMMKLAVESACAHTTLIPYAVIRPSEVSHQRTTWLRTQGVHIVISGSTWEQHVVQMLSRSSANDISASHLYRDSDATIATYARLQIAHLKELAHLEHILYTDVDVFFRKDILLLGNSVSLPDSIQMGFEEKNEYPLNAGVFVASIPFLRETREHLQLAFVSTQTVLDTRYGPGDQGLLNKVYEKQLRANGALQSDLNAKPYQRFSETALILHFHGPKLFDYGQYAQQGTCRKPFMKLCRKGLTNGLCKYLREINFVRNGAALIEQMTLAEYRALVSRCGIREFVSPVHN